MSSAPATARPRALPPRRRARDGARMVTAGGLLAGVMIAVAVAGVFTVPGTGTVDEAAALQPPSLRHLFGTDQFGRDVLARVVAAARTDLAVAAVIVLIALAAGTAVGLVSGYAGRWADAVIMRVTDVAMAFPFLVLVLAVAAARGPGTGNLIFAASLVWWVSYARLARAQVLAARNLAWMEAAQVAGAPPWRQILRHLLPNVITQQLVYASSDVVGALLLTTSVSFLGLGVQPPAPEWGQMIFAAEDYMPAAWWMAVFPGLAIVLTGLACSWIGDGLAAMTTTT